MPVPSQLFIAQPDDWHLHLRDGAVMAAITPHSVRHFARAIVMPNLMPPVVTGDDAAAYRDRVMSTVPPNTRFTPLMTLYLTEATSPQDVVRSAGEGIIHAVKMYPAGATTNSDSGVRDVARVMPVLEAMAEAGVPLLVHGEVTHAEVDIFDREAVFIDTVLAPLHERVPDLRIVLEHITTADGVDFVMSHDSNVAATITPHHLVINRNALFAGGIRPHYYCLPIAKRERHRQALLGAATSGDARFFHGTDSAPHVDAAKLSECGCAGIFNAPNAIPCLAQVFENAGALDQLEAFASTNGPAFYRMPVNEAKLRLVRHEEARPIPDAVSTPDGPVSVFDPGMPIHWSVAGID